MSGQLLLFDLSGLLLRGTRVSGLPVGGEEDVFLVELGDYFLFLELGLLLEVSDVGLVVIGH
jgi:hypothetical protein